MSGLREEIAFRLYYMYLSSTNKMPGAVLRSGKNKSHYLNRVPDSNTSLNLRSWKNGDQHKNFFPAIFFFNKTLSYLREGRKKKGKSLSRVRLFATPWTVAHQAPPSMGFSRQEYWSGLPFPSPREVT